MNKATTQAMELAAAKARLDALEQGITDLRAYLISEKFHVDTTVQVTDVLLRLSEARTHALDAEDAAVAPYLVCVCGCREDFHGRYLGSAYCNGRCEAGWVRTCGGKFTPAALAVAGIQ